MLHYAYIRQPRSLLSIISLVLISACHGRAPSRELVEVQVQNIGFDPAAQAPVVLLQDRNGGKSIPIWIGMAEAQAIAWQLQGKAALRPLTHDLLKTILEQVGVEFDRVLVNDLKEGTYYARIHLINGGKVLEVDSRPSDAIALALRFHRPIFVERSLFDSSPSSQIVEHETTTRTAAPLGSTKIFGLTVQGLTEALAAHFDLPDTQGVLVTEVEGKSGGVHLQRGDVIVAVGNEPVDGVEDLQQKLRRERGHVVSVRIRRDSEESDVSLSLTQEESVHTKEEAE